MMKDIHTENQADSRVIAVDRERSLKKLLFRWEFTIIFLFVLINIINAMMSKNYLNLTNLSNTLKMFLDKGIIACPMMMVLLLGEIDISVASQIALTGTVMGWCASKGANIFVVVTVGIALGALLGGFNGFLITKFTELSSTIITLATEILYRGLAWMILENNAYTAWPEAMHQFSWGSIGGIPIILFVFITEILLFAYVVHFTKFGRSLYAMGRNEKASLYSGLRTARIKRIVYMVTGIFSALASVFLCSKLGSSRANMAMNYEMDVIAMVILGGVSVSGGVGNVVGVAFSVFVIGLLRYGLGLINVSSEIIMIIIGTLLIVPIAIPNLKRFRAESDFLTMLKRKQHRGQTQEG